MAGQVTLADVQRWRNLPPERRTEFYIEYARLTGSEQAMQQASISQFSGPLGGAALVANFYVKSLADNYPNISISEFSNRIKIAELNAIEANLNIPGGTGILSDLDMAIAARNGWIGVQLGDWSPVNAEVLKEGIEAAFNGDHRYVNFGVTRDDATSLAREVGILSILAQSIAGPGVSHL